MCFSFSGGFNNIWMGVYRGSNQQRHGNENNRFARVFYPYFWTYLESIHVNDKITSECVKLLPPEIGGMSITSSFFETGDWWGLAHWPYEQTKIKVHSQEHGDNQWIMFSRWLKVLSNGSPNWGPSTTSLISQWLSGMILHVNMRNGELERNIKRQKWGCPASADHNSEHRVKVRTTLRPSGHPSAGAGLAPVWSTSYTWASAGYTTPHHDLEKWQCWRQNHLVGGFNLPLWKMMEFVSWVTIPNIWKK